MAPTFWALEVRTKGARLHGMSVHRAVFIGLRYPFRGTSKTTQNPKKTTL